MKKIKLFDRGVFREGFRHLKVPGIIFLVVYLVPIIISFISFLTTSKPNVNIANIIGGYDVGYSFVRVSFLVLIIAALYILVAPVLTISAFRFLTKRNASDIYHSLPFQRETIFLSLFASVAAWLGIITFGSSILSAICNLILSSSAFVFSRWILSALASFISMLFVAACFSIAVSITGTLASNIVVGFLITYLPRLIITSITQAVISSLPILSSEHLSFFLNNQYNLVTSSYSFSFLTRSYSSLNLPSIYGCIYTFAVAVIYIALACILFRRRKSESAGQSAPNRTLQAVYRISLCMVICIYILTSLFNSVIKNNTKNISNIWPWYILAVVVYFAYEIITTKQFKSLLKALPGFGIVVVLNLAIYGIMAGVRSYELNYTPAKEEITSVAVSIQNANKISYHYNNYVDSKTIDIDLYDEEVISIVAESLKENVDALKVSQKDYIIKYTEYYVHDITNPYVSTTVKIKTAFGSKYRYIYLKSEDLSKIKNIYCDNDEYKELYRYLPKKSNGSVRISMDNMPKMLSDKKLNAIYDVVRDEIAECDYESLYKLMNNQFSDSIRLNYSYYDLSNYHDYDIAIPLHPDITPKAYEMVLEEYYAVTTENRDNIKSMLSKNNDFVHFQFYNGTGAKSYSNSFNSSISDSITSFIKEHEKEGAPKIGDSFVVITINSYTSASTYGSSTQIFTIINLGDADVKSLIYS